MGDFWQRALQFSDIQENRIIQIGAGILTFKLLNKKGRMRYFLIISSE